MLLTGIQWEVQTLHCLNLNLGNAFTGWKIEFSSPLLDLNNEIYGDF